MQKRSCCESAVGVGMKHTNLCKRATEKPLSILDASGCLCAAGDCEGCNALAEAFEQIVLTLRVMVDHASEAYPHFEDTRGKRDIREAREALELAARWIR